ncbi:unnamed protein product, partial [Symbiodinium microadriaticum]
MPPVGSNPIPDPEHDTSSDSEVEDERAASPIPLPPSTQELPEAVTEALSMTLEPLPQDASSSSGAADDWTDVRSSLPNGDLVSRENSPLRTSAHDEKMQEASFVK